MNPPPVPESAEAEPLGCADDVALAVGNTEVLVAAGDESSTVPQAQSTSATQANLRRQVYPSSHRIDSLRGKVTDLARSNQHLGAGTAARATGPGD